MSDIYFVELINAEPYKQYNLTDNMPGMAVEENGEIITVIFFNPYNCGKGVFADVRKNDLRRVEEEFPEQLKPAIMGKLEQVRARADKKIERPPFAECDRVELIVEKKKYAELGIHKGDVGIVCFDEAVDDSMEVAFPTFDENGEERGDVSFAVKIKDLKLVLRRGESEPKDI